MRQLMKVEFGCELDTHKKRENWEIFSIRLSYGNVCEAVIHCWVMWEDVAHCGWCHPWAVGPRLYKKEDELRPEEQACKQEGSTAMLQILPSDSCRDSFLTFLKDGLSFGSENTVNTFLPKLIFARVFYLRNWEQTRTPFYQINLIYDTFYMPGE